MPPRHVPTPPGFLLLGMLLATLGGACTIGVASTGTEHVVRALLGVVALLTLALVEALWWVRPWVVRAVDAWAAGCVGALLLPSLGSVAIGMLGFSELTVVTLVTLLFVGLPCAGVRWYVRDRARRLGLAP
jgi:hypothetical protein